MDTQKFSRRSAALLLAGLAALAANGAVAQEKLKMTFAMPTTAAPYLLPFFIAQDMGWYEKAGLTVEEKVVSGDTNCMRAVISGDADTTYIGPNTIMQAALSGGQMKIVGSWQPIVDYRIVARAGGATQLKDLADKRWAISSVGGMVQALPKLMMKKENIDSANAKFISIGGYAQRYQALVAGTADATLLDTALTIRGEKEKTIKYIAAVADDFPKMGFVFFPVRTSALSKPSERRALEIFMREGIRAARFIVENPRAAAEVMEKRQKTSDVDGMTEVLKAMTELKVWGLNGGLEKDVYDFSHAIYRETGEVKADVPYEKLVDTSIVEASLKTLGRR